MYTLRRLADGNAGDHFHLLEVDDGDTAQEALRHPQLASSAVMSMQSGPPGTLMLPATLGVQVDHRDGALDAPFAEPVAAIALGPEIVCALAGLQAASDLAVLGVDDHDAVFAGQCHQDACRQAA